MKLILKLLNDIGDMKVIFIQDVNGVAKRNTIREVANGFAVNYLLPRGLAVRATPEKIQALSQQQQSQAQQQAQEQSRAFQLAAALNGKTVTLTRPASSTGTLYAGITAAMVVEAVKQQLGVNLQPKQVSVSSHIKTVGQHQVMIHLSPQAKATLNLQINAG